MLIRRLVVLIGTLTVMAGVLQVLLRHRVEELSRSALAGNAIYVLAGLAVVAGIILIWSAAFRLVRIYRLVLALGLISVLSGLFVIAAPAFARDLANSLYFNRAEIYRTLSSSAGGVLRIVLGALLIYSGLRPPSPRTPRLGSIVPLA